jgi:hypothetical protein
MALWILLTFIFMAGALGGIINAYISDNGFLLPKTEVSANSKIIRPGYLGNVFVSGVAACISWGLYGPFAASYIWGGPKPAEDASPAGLTLAALVGAVLVGVAGARWLTNEVDKNLFRAAASEAAAGKASPEKAKQIAMAAPADALRIAKRDDMP